METLQHTKLNEELLTMLASEEYLGTQHRTNSKLTLIYSYSPRLMKQIINTRYSKCAEWTQIVNYGNVIKVCVNLKDVSKELLMTLATQPHAKGWTPITVLTEERNNLTPVCKSEYLFRDECNRFYIKS